MSATNPNRRTPHDWLPIGTRVKLGEGVYRPGLFLQDGTTAKFSTGHIHQHLKNGGVAVKFDGYRHIVDYTASEARRFEMI